MGKVIKAHFESFAQTIPLALNALGVGERIGNEPKIILKPNLTIDHPPPATTDVALVAAVADYCRKHAPDTEIIIAEGTGVGSTTPICYEKLGYHALAKSHNLSLVDLNHAELIKISRPNFTKFKQIEFPALLLDSFLISLPVLKGHQASQEKDAATVSLSLKNMMGCYPRHSPSGDWKRKMHHHPIEYSIVDINLCKRPDLTILDASIGSHKGPGYHPNGLCDPPLKLILAGYAPVSVDAVGASLLGYDWQLVKHIQLSHQAKIGSAQDIHILPLD